LLAADDCNAICAGLESLGAAHAAGEWSIELADEDAHGALERRLIEKIGAAGGRVHLGRSRNDQVLVALRLYLLDAIAEYLGEAIEPGGAAAGMHLTLGLRGAVGSSAAETERQIASSAAAMGVGVYPLHPYCVERRESPGFILGYAALSTVQVREGIRRLAEAVES
jgi:DNA-binding transcriptional MocR family regulator